MADLEELKTALKKEAESTLHTKWPLSDVEYSAGFDLFVQDQNSTAQRDFIVPHLAQTLTSLLGSKPRISILEIGPGPTSVLSSLPNHLTWRIRSYTAFEPNALFATRLEASFRNRHNEERSQGPFHYLEMPPDIRQLPFDIETETIHESSATSASRDRRYDLVLFCHSMYGMKPKDEYVRKAMGMIVPGGEVVVFHREGSLKISGLVCYRTASFPTGLIRIRNDDNLLDRFASFITGYRLDDVDETLRSGWRKVCRDLALKGDPRHVSFSSPEFMMIFNQHADVLPELAAHVPFAREDKQVKNWEARRQHPAAILMPKEVAHIQHCVRWASKYNVGLTVVGGGHSGQCLWSNIVAINMSAFNQIHIVMPQEKDVEGSTQETGSLVVVESGCKTGDIISTTMAAGLTIPLGSRPSVGSGLWLQGGLGHLSRLHGLACDAIVGAVMISVDSGEVLCVGQVPRQYQPVDAIRATDESDILMVIKGAGSNFGIVLSVTFKAFAPPKYYIRNWVLPVADVRGGQRALRDVDVVARKLPRNASIDPYLYWDLGQLYVGLTLFEVCASGVASTLPTSVSEDVAAIWGTPLDTRAVDGVGLFETEMYVSSMHGGHVGGKTSSFKRCIFLKNIGDTDVVNRLLEAIRTRPTPQSYLHLLHGGGAVRDVAEDATAFGCRDWEFACVITAVWPRHDSTGIAKLAMQWVYKIVEDLLPLAGGVYGADLGPDPRDESLAKRAFGGNRPWLARVKQRLDPHNVLAFACPLPKLSLGPKLIVIVTGKEGAGKDHSADIWASVFRKSNGACVMSISDVTKREYAAATGADLSLLKSDRQYKEQHRPALTEFFQEQVRKRPRLPEEHFENLARTAVDEDVLFITGMRDEAPVAAFSHLVPHIKVIEVHVQSNEHIRSLRRGLQMTYEEHSDQYGDSTPTALDYQPTLLFDNNTNGNQAAEQFATQLLLPLCHEDLRTLHSMVSLKPDFPSAGIPFRHVLDVAHHPGGLALCTSLLRSHFVGDWTHVGAIVSCEAGGFVFAAPLALSVNIPLVLVRESGKLPPPTVSVTHKGSYISSARSGVAKSEQIEIAQDAIPGGKSVVVVDDVFSTGATLLAVLQLLNKAGVEASRITVMVVAEFPQHRGRKLLRDHGFGRISVQSLLVFGGI